ncbi:hypothetical protein [Amycolatopsis plumensis]|uniref:Uncharacterized protein n=1 Tax=Amycolatopsis plumensis TaxID=236508 RepID=A0ABV5UFS3_9PSEU
MHDKHAEAPRSVAELAADPGWVVTTTETTGQWLTAERVVERNGQRRLIGLTPVQPGTVALMLWSGSDVVGHRRGPEADACATAYRWVTELDAGN